VRHLSTVFISLIILDRALKLLIFNRIGPGFSYPIIKGVLHITPIYNSGIAFGMFKGDNSPVFIAISLIISAVIFYLLLFKRPLSRILSTGFVLILSGAIGNVIDRIAYSSVLDYIDIRIWPVFNLSDSAITIGVCLIIWSMIITKTLNPKH